MVQVMKLGLQKITGRGFSVRYLLISFLAFMAAGCCSFVVKSEETVYRGKLDPKIADTTVEIFADNLERGIFKNGSIRPGWKSLHPDTSGYFLVAGTTPSHDDCEHPNHWDNGPFEIYIRGPHIQDYHDTLSVEELKALPKLDPASVGRKLSRAEIGIWQLPDIVLQPK
jgi:hypothetical protein